MPEKLNLDKTGCPYIPYNVYKEEEKEAVIEYSGNGIKKDVELFFIKHGRLVYLSFPKIILENCQNNGIVKFGPGTIPPHLLPTAEAIYMSALNSDTSQDHNSKLTGTVTLYHDGRIEFYRGLNEGEFEPEETGDITIYPTTLTWITGHAYH